MCGSKHKSSCKKYSSHTNCDNNYNNYNHNNWSSMNWRYSNIRRECEINPCNNWCNINSIYNNNWCNLGCHPNMIRSPHHHNHHGY